MRAILKSSQVARGGFGVGSCSPIMLPWNFGLTTTPVNSFDAGDGTAFSFRTGPVARVGNPSATRIAVATVYRMADSINGFRQLSLRAAKNQGQSGGRMMVVVNGNSAATFPSWPACPTNLPSASPARG